MTTGGLTNRCRVEVSSFDEHICGCFSGTRIQATEYTGDTHRFFGIANHQVLVRKLAFHFIESHELSTFGTSLHHNLATLNLVGIEAMQRLTISVKDVVGNIDDVVDRTKTNQAQLVLQPFRTFLHSHTLDAYAGITRTSFHVFHFHFDVQVIVFHLEGIYRRTLQFSLMTILNQVSIKVASHTIVWASIGTVWSDVHFEHIFALDVVVILGRSTRYGIFRKHDDTGMAGTDTDFVFGTNHTVRFYTTELWFLDSKAIVTIIKLGTECSNYYLLTGGYIRCTAHNLYRFALSQVDGGYMHVVRIRMRHASQHFADDDTFQTTLDSLDFFYAPSFKTDGSQRRWYFFRSQIEVDVFFQPIIRDIHIWIFLLFS